MPRDHLDLGDLSDGMAAELGVLAVRVTRAVEALDRSAGCTCTSSATAERTCTRSCWPAGRDAPAARFLNLALWEEMLPRVPAEEAAAVLAVAVEALADLGEARA